MSLTTGELEFATHDGRAVGARWFGVELVQGVANAVEAGSGGNGPLAGSGARRRLKF